MTKLLRYEVARAFVLNGARVIMVNRKEDQGQAAIGKIKEEAGEHAQIEWISCDMGNLKQIKETFTRLRGREERLDLVYRDRCTLSSAVLANHNHSSFFLLALMRINTARQLMGSIVIFK